MGHYDECRDGYCGSCGAAPGNIKNGVCQFCGPKKAPVVTAKKAVLQSDAKQPINVKRVHLGTKTFVKRTTAVKSEKIHTGGETTVIGGVVVKKSASK